MPKNGGSFLLFFAIEQRNLETGENDLELKNEYETDFSIYYAYNYDRFARSIPLLFVFLVKND